MYGDKSYRDILLVVDQFFLNLIMNLNKNFKYYFPFELTIQKTN